MGFVLYQISNMFFIARWHHLLGFTFLGFAIYLGILFLLKEFTKKDVDLFLDTLNIKKMIQYIKEEMRGK